MTEFAESTSLRRAIATMLRAEPNLTAWDVAERLECSRTAVRRVAKALGLQLAAAEMGRRKRKPDVDPAPAAMPPAELEELIRVAVAREVRDTLLGDETLRFVRAAIDQWLKLNPPSLQVTDEHIARGLDSPQFSEAIQKALAANASGVLMRVMWRNDGALVKRALMSHVEREEGDPFIDVDSLANRLANIVGTGGPNFVRAFFKAMGDPGREFFASQVRAIVAKAPQT